MYGDFPLVAATVAAADVVTLDRVVCCDPNYAAMLGAAASRARRLVAFSYPRPWWGVRAFLAVANAANRLLGQAFRAHVHPPDAMAAVLERAGLKRHWAGGSWIWAVEHFERAV
jgi:magnesium-protoporphyrin O-methyltransferase